MQRLAILVFAALIGGAFSLAPTGCAHPYSSKPQKLRKVKKKKRPKKEISEADTAIVWDEACKVNFFDDKPPKRRYRKRAMSMAAQADSMINEAQGLAGAPQILKVIDAIKKLKNALKKDQFSAIATYKLASAYTVVRKKGCALKLLERLNELQKMPAVTRDAELAIKRAVQDQAFDGFRKDADSAMGE